MVLAENMVKKATKDAITLCLQENNKARKGSHMTSTMESDDSSVVSMTDSIITEETQSSISGINIKYFTSFNLSIPNHCLNYNQHSYVFMLNNFNGIAKLLSWLCVS